jgi:acid phosphatase
MIPRPRTRIVAALGGAAGLAALSHATVPPATGATVTPTKVLTVVEENHSYAQAKAGMPYLMSLANSAHGSYSSNFHAIRHPSLPNYIAIAGGHTFEVSTDNEPIPSPQIGNAPSVFGQALAKGLTAKTYAESMTTNCQATSGGGYAPKHNPWVYFGSEASKCKRFDVPATSFLSDATNNRLPNVGMLVPNLCNDAHNCSLGKADNWLKARLPTVMKSTDYTSGRLTIVVTFDEDDRNTSTNQILTVVLNAGMAHRVSTTNLNLYSLTGYYEHVIGAPLLRNARTGFAPAFGLR